MATIFSHALVGSTIITLLPKNYRTSKLFSLGALTAILPDLDYLGFIKKVPYASLWGHRGFTHSLFFSFIVSFIISGLMNRKNNKSYFSFFIIFFLTTISHACLDACTNGGLGVAFYSPFNTSRYFFPWRPIQVSPMGIRFFSEKGFAVLINEFYWIFIPCGAIFFARYLLRDRNLNP